jgi:hypothetical protein
MFPGSRSYVPDGVQELLTAEAAEHAENIVWLRVLGALCGERLLGGSRVDGLA